jgi:hypothetical protein
MAVTSPVDETVITVVLVDTHVALLVQSCVEESLNVTVQVNCAVEPMYGVVPVTATLVTVSGAVGVELHADRNRPATATGRTTTSERNELPMRLLGATPMLATVTAGTFIRRLNCVNTVLKV